MRVRFRVRVRVSVRVRVRARARVSSPALGSRGSRGGGARRWSLTLP